MTPTKDKTQNGSPVRANRARKTKEPTVPIADQFGGLTVKERAGVVRFIRIMRAGGWIPRFMLRICDLDWEQPDYHSLLSFKEIEKLLREFECFDSRISNAKKLMKTYPELFVENARYDEFLEDEEQRLFGPWNVPRSIPFPDLHKDD